MAIAHNYKRRYEIERLRVLRRCVDRIPAGGRLIEFGCNAGAMTEGFARTFESVVAIDYDRDLIAQASERIGAGNVEFMQYDLNDDLPERLHGEFDAAIALEVIEHLASPDAFLRQVRRCLRPGGRLLISAPNLSSPEGILGRFLAARDGISYTAWDDSHISLFKVGRLLDLLNRAGFTIDRLTGYYYGFETPKIRTKIRIHWSTALWPMNRLGFDVVVEGRAAVPLSCQEGG